MTWESAQDRAAYALATWFGCGLVPLAPGTMGTLGAIPLYLAVRPAGRWAVALTALGVGAVGIWSGTIVARKLKQHDPQIVCIDEVAGVLVTYLGAPAGCGGWGSVALGFVVFRVLDTTKPWPARVAERSLPGGWGIMLDDIVAGAWGAMLLALLGRAVGK
jgi:phosphatidylglycerophosphatase A